MKNFMFTPGGPGESETSASSEETTSKTNPENEGQSQADEDNAVEKGTGDTIGNP